MNKELKEEAEYNADKWIKCAIDHKSLTYWNSYVDGYIAGAEPREKCIEELEKEISVLLSCKNCPENKGGFICVKEYENKCLAQKIQYIKELKEENKVLAQNLEDTEILNKTYEKRFSDLEKENTELRLKLEALEGQTPWKDIKDKSKVIEQFTKAKELLKDFVALNRYYDWNLQLANDTEQFLRDIELRG